MARLRPAGRARSGRRGHGARPRRCRGRCGPVTCVIATGGAGQCFAVTTNPALSTGDGIAMAHAGRRGGGRPRVHAVPPDRAAPPVDAAPAALRGAARRGRDPARRARRRVHARRAPARRPRPARRRGQGDQPPPQRARPRPPVARRHRDRRLPARFPTIWEACRAVGLDPTRDWLPVAPAAHYLSGGVCTDLDGATTLPGLWACGEAACSGVHGANRLASNSLLEGLVFAARAVEAIVAGRDGCATDRGAAARARRRCRARAASMPSPPCRASPIRDELQRVMTRDAGVLRSAESLDARGRRARRAWSPTDVESANLLAVSTVLRARRDRAARVARHAHPRRPSRSVGRVPRSFRVRERAGTRVRARWPTTEHEPSR